jgi:3-oxoacyl-[acyl-carrier-protein] synthase III
MIAEGLGRAIAVLRKISKPLEAIKAIFPHTVSKSAIDAAASRVGVSNLVYSVFPSVGNLASASIPAGLSLALREERIREGDIVAGLVGSAGMVFSAYTFTI